MPRTRKTQRAGGLNRATRIIMVSLLVVAVLMVPVSAFQQPLRSPSLVHMPLRPRTTSCGNTLPGPGLLHPVYSRRSCILYGQIPGGGSNDFHRLLEQQMRNAQTWSRSSGVSGFIFPAILFAMYLSGQFKWLFDLVNFFFIMVFVVPVIAIVGVNLWVRASIVEGSCPSCNSPVVAVKGQQSMCAACGTPIYIDNGKIERVSKFSKQVDEKTGTEKQATVVDVDVIDVDVK